MTGQQGDALLLRQLPQLRYQQAQQDQSDAAHSHDADVLPQHGGTQQGGAGGAQSAEQACTLGGGVALCHRLEGEAEAGADDGKAGDHQPLGTGLGQVGCLEHEGGHQRQQAQRTHLNDAQGQGIVLVGEAVGGDDGCGVQHGGHDHQHHTGGEAAGLAGQQCHAADGHQCADGGGSLGQLMPQHGLRHGYQNDGGILQQGDGGGGGALEPRQLRGEHQEEQSAHDGATHQRMALDVAQALEKHHRQQHKGHQKPGRQQVEDPHAVHGDLAEQKGRSPCCDNCRQKDLRFFLSHDACSSEGFCPFLIGGFLSYP